MCCLFGFIDCGRTLSARRKTMLIQALAAESEVRGTDAAGIAYNSGGRLRLYKRPGPARKCSFRIPDDARVVMGHSRMTTQGKAKYNRNNHPFSGKVPGTRFALAHNGVLYNDHILRAEKHLPHTGIQTDSYVAVQLIEQQRALTPDSLKYMAESVEGSFVFTLLDDKDNFYFVRGSNPLCLEHFPRLGLYVYASTWEILHRALEKTWLGREASVQVPVDSGEILSITPEGGRLSQRFDLGADGFAGWYFSRRGSHLRHPACGRQEDPYLLELKSIASSLGYSGEEIDAMLDEGWTTDEIEEALYGWEMDGLPCM